MVSRGSRTERNNMRLSTRSARAVLFVLMTFAPCAAADSKLTVSGEIIDSACYIKMGAKGESHRECAQKCADAGIPLALLEDGTGNVIWLASVADMETPNAKLRPHAGRKVTITGTYAERGGVKIFLVESIQAAKR